MSTFRKPIWSLLIVLLLAIVPGAASADDRSAMVIDSQVLITSELLPHPEPYSLVVQAIGWQGLTYRYILTITNLSPWAIPAAYVLDRYLPELPGQEEIVYDWLPGRIGAHQTVGMVIEFPDGPLPGACHQVEISLADGLGTVLMDCSSPGSVTVWNVPMTAAMEAYLAEIAAPVPQPQGGSKLGLHVTRNSNPSIMQFVRQIGPAVIVAVGDVSWLADVKEDSPETLTIGRLLEGDQSFNDHPVARARAYVAAAAATYAANPRVDYWLGWNEPVIDEQWQMEWYAAFEAERVNALAKLGLKAAIGNFSAGTPEANEFGAFLPAVEAAKAHGGILAVHEYSAPSMRDGVGAGIPGLEATDSHGALTLRYRFWYQHFLQPNDLVIPLVVTEAGIDGGVLQGMQPQLFGWRDFQEGLPEGMSALTWQDYAAQLSWYDDQLRSDPYVLGFAIFNAGDPDGQWASFDVTDKLPDLVEMMASKQ
jgi:hypothetical protein